MATTPINDVVPFAQFTAAPGATQFDFNWWIGDGDDIGVYVNGVEKDPSTYVVTGVQSTTGGTVTLNVALAGGEVVTLLSEFPIERLTGYITGGSFRADSLNLELSTHIAIMLQLNRDIQRKLGVSSTSTVDPANLELPTPEDGKVLAWDGTGGAMKNGPTIDNIAGASASADAAAASASAAATSASTASTAASTASTAASTASTAASTASTAATSAMGSASAAATSATSASTSAGNASTSATAAAGSATSASGSATAAATSATNAGTSETNAAASATAAAASAAKLQGTSTTSVAVGTGSKSFTTQTGKFFSVGTYLNIVSNGTPANTMFGQVSAYNTGTGALTVTVVKTTGSGTNADWNIAVAGAQGAAGSVTDGDYGDVNISSSGSVYKVESVAGSLQLLGTISPTQLTANTNDWNPTGLSGTNTIRFSTDASRNLTSLAGGADGRVITLENIGSNNLVLKHDDGATGTAANRLYCPNSADYTLAANASVELRYDSTSSRWRVLGVPVPAAVVPVNTNVARLRMTNDGTTPNSKISIQADSAVLTDDTGKTVMFYGSGISITVDLTFNGLNGYSYAAVGFNNCFIFVYLVSDGTNLRAVAQAYPNGTNLFIRPQVSSIGASAYTYWAFLGTMVTDGSGNLKRTQQIENQTQFVVTASTNTAALPLISSGAVGTYSATTPTWSGINMNTVIPPNASNVKLLFDNGYGGTLTACAVALNTSYSGVKGTNPPLWDAAAADEQCNMVSFTPEGNSIAKAGTCAIQCLGWTEGSLQAR